MFSEKKVDYNAVDEKIDGLRKKSLKYLMAALKGEKYDYE